MSEENKIESVADEPKPEEKLTPLTKEESQGFLEAEIRNLNQAKNAKQEAQRLEIAAARIRARADEDAEKILEKARKEAENLKSGNLTKARKQFAQEMFSDGSWDRDSYNVYIEKHNLNKPLAVEDVEEIFAKRNAEFLDTVRQVIQKNVPDQTTSKQSARISACKEKLATLGFDDAEALALLKTRYEKDPENFIPERETEAILLKFTKQQEKKEILPDEKVIDERRKNLFSFLEK